jgi:hypothetical protein
VLYLVNRPGNAPSHAGAAQWIDKAVELVTAHAARVCLRGDTDFSLTAHFDQWAQRVDFVFGMDCNAALRSRAETLTEACWTPLRRIAAAPPRTGQRRKREPNHKRRTSPNAAISTSNSTPSTWPSSLNGRVGHRSDTRRRTGRGH